MTADPIMEINPHNVEKYFKKHNWKCIHTYPDGRSTLWEKNGRTARLIPDPSMYSDYRSIMFRTLHTIAEMEQTENVYIFGIMPTIEKIQHGGEV